MWVEWDVGSGGWVHHKFIVRKLMVSAFLLKMRKRSATGFSERQDRLFGVRACRPGAAWLHQWYSSSFQCMLWTGERHLAQKWCDDCGSCSDDVHAQGQECRHNTRRRLPCSRFAGLDSLSRSMENNLRTEELGIMGPNCCQKPGKFLRRTVESTGGCQTPGTWKHASRSFVAWRL